MRKFRIVPLRTNSLTYNQQVELNVVRKRTAIRNKIEAMRDLLALGKEE
jgi:hypothetical protein